MRIGDSSSTWSFVIVRVHATGQHYLMFTRRSEAMIKLVIIEILFSLGNTADAYDNKISYRPELVYVLR